ncbi:hypothetical protein PPERSA_07680 [Pseudocohnilembus persalinus]|uniref:CHCH domain-containing protein n=1 Tax=Pseudocohnilembus persalinus TaxID=266149 RepID=A0A0V0QIA8_PSEPJ|nr:hypothetical protein PPERSA_07680 [Pseudocohnilembus persalinus]|eukprot:KRX02035.1 hypothetical protein PPERSA_07680 [Pseudocohnilembus persalinus]
MDTKAFEVLIHSQYAFDVCREQVYNFEDCRQTDTPIPRNPADCKKQAKEVLSCYKESEKMDPICTLPFNDSRECLFKADGNLYNCKEWVNLYVHCQKDPLDYKSFLEASSAKQLKSKSFDFVKYRGHFDKYL